MPAIGLMNLLTRLGPILGLTGKATSRIGEKVFKGRPIWQRAKPAQKAKREFGIPKRTDPDYKGEGKKVFRHTPAQPEVPPGIINRLYMTPTTAGGQLARLGATVAATDYGLGKVMGLFDDEETSDLQSVGSISTPGSIFPAQPNAPSYDIENRQAYQQRVQDKMNKDMRRLLQYYGIVNLVNPDAAPNMLKLGTAMLQQDIQSMGSERQAKIFDTVFGDKPPTTAMDAYQRVMKAGGSVEDAEAISGMVADAMPATSSRAPTTAEVKLQIMAELKSLIAQGREEEAKQLYMDAVYNNIINTPTGENALAMSPEAAAQAYIDAMRSSGVATGNEGLYNLVKID